MTRRRPPTGPATGLLVLAAGLGLAATLATAATGARVSQKNRTFEPRDVSVARGDTVEVLNDDGELLHHIYVSARGFEFDSGEQEPGAKVDIRFPAAGTYTVLCRIHPRMRLNVTVK